MPPVVSAQATGLRPLAILTRYEAEEIPAAPPAPISSDASKLSVPLTSESKGGGI